MSHRAFTYIELMVVFTVIAILAAIAVPNFLTAQVRVRVARARADMATLCAALANYRLDHHAYPPNFRWVDQTLGFAATDEATAAAPAPAAPSVRPPEALDQSVSPLVALTTPTPYVTALAPDPFNLRRDGNYVYLNWSRFPEGGARVEAAGAVLPAVLASEGPDNCLDLLYPQPVGILLYDPTNGTVSGGDLFEHPR